MQIMHNSIPSIATSHQLIFTRSTHAIRSIVTVATTIVDNSPVYYLKDLDCVAVMNTTLFQRQETDYCQN